MKSPIIRLCGGTHDGHEMGVPSPMPGVIETELGGDLYTYATRIDEGTGEDRQEVRLYRHAHVISLEE